MGTHASVEIKLLNKVVSDIPSTVRLAEKVPSSVTVQE